MSQKFECDKCGACCRSLIVEADYIDATREPRILQTQRFSDVTLDELRTGERCVVLYDTITRACPFLDSETNECGIYPTRPNVCVMVEAGDAKCQQARLSKGFELLNDVDGSPPDRSELRLSCEDYELDYDEHFA